LGNAVRRGILLGGAVKQRRCTLGRVG
jgi:hypothetical protein